MSEKIGEDLAGSKGNTDFPQDITANNIANTLVGGHNDYNDMIFVDRFHDANQEDIVNITTTRMLENIIVQHFPDNSSIYRAELGGGSHIGSNHYSLLFDKAHHVDRVDNSQNMLNKAREVLQTDLSKAQKVSLHLNGFIDYLENRGDNSLDAVNMKYCINYLRPEDMHTFMNLLHRKLRKGGIFTANYGMRKGVLPPYSPTCKFLYNGKEISEPVQLQDGDIYTIIFIDPQGNPINKGTTKYYYSKEFFLNAANDQNNESFDAYIGSSDQYFETQISNPIGVVVLKKK